MISNIIMMILTPCLDEAHEMQDFIAGGWKKKTLTRRQNK
jgi:hypothetical protein